MTVSRPISAQAKGALESVVPAAVQNAKGNDTYRDLERDCGIHAGFHFKEEHSA
jgi:hypothetical protein